MFKKSKRNIRLRKADSDSDDDTTNNTNTGAQVLNAAQSIVTKSNLLNRQNANEPEKLNGNSMPEVASAGSVLSFELEEEGEVFQIKKSSHSKKIVRQLKKETEDEKINQSLKLKSNQKVLAKSSKALKLTSEDDDESDKSESNSKPLGPSVQDILKSGAIPDANLIHLARKKRQMARECGEEYIPIDDTQRYEKNNSRLIRDDDNDASDSDEDNNVLAITMKQKDMQRRRIEEKILAAEEGFDSDSDHDKQWEEQQIKKGTNIPAQVIVNTPTTNNNYNMTQHQLYLLNNYASNNSNNYNNAYDNMNYTINNNNNNMTALDQMELNALTNAKQSKKEKSLTERLDDLRQRYHANQRDRDDSRHTITTTLTSVEEARKQIVVVEEQYKFFQEMKAFFRDYVECMNEKMTSINYLDRCMMELLKQRADKLVARRQEDVKDQSIEYAFGKATPTTSTTSSTEPQSNDDAVRKRRKAERDGRRARRKRDREKKGIKEHKEGMSTDDEQINSEVAKFNAEKDRLTNDIKTTFDDVIEEFCSIPQVLSRIERWKKEQSDSYIEAYIGLCLPKLFTPLIKVQLIVWNPLEPYCRNFEKLLWYQELLNFGTIEHPIENESKTKIIEKPAKNNVKNKTYNSSDHININHDVKRSKDKNGGDDDDGGDDDVANIDNKNSPINGNNNNNDGGDNDGGDDDDSDGGADDDADVKLIPNIIDKILLPRINGLVDSIWDPMSLKQTTNLSNVIKQIVNDYPLIATENKNLQSLILSINKRIMKSVNDDLFIPLYPKNVLENRLSEATMFFNRQVYSCLKLMNSIVLWQNVISDQQLQTLTLDKVLNRYLIIAMSNSPFNVELISLCQKISSLIPQEWFTEYMEGITLPQLEGFCKFLVNSASNLKAHMSSNLDYKDHIKQVGKILLSLHAESHASVVSKMIGVRISND